MNMELRRSVLDIVEDVNAMRLIRYIAKPGNVNFIKPRDSSRVIGENTHSQDLESSISVLEYLERLKGEDAGG